MNKYKYVVVSGCSFSSSDNPNLVNPGETYGDLIAEHLGAKFYNLSMGGASLQYMNRKTLEWCSRNTDKFEDTLIIFGMTGLNRLEIWSNGFNSWYNCPNYLQVRRNMPLPKSKLFKHGFSPEERKRWFMNFYNDKTQFYYATNMLIGLQSFMTLNSIDHIFFDALEPIDTWPMGEDELGYKLLYDNLVSQENWYKHPEYKSMIDFTKKNLEMRVSKGDEHPNKKAHRYWGECLLEYINEKFKEKYNE